MPGQSGHPQRVTISLKSASARASPRIAACKSTFGTGFNCPTRGTTGTGAAVAAGACCFSCPTLGLLATLRLRLGLHLRVDCRERFTPPTRLHRVELAHLAP